MQKGISRSSYNFWYRFVAVFLGNNETTGKEQQNNTQNYVRSEIKGRDTIISAWVLQ